MRQQLLQSNESPLVLYDSPSSIHAQYARSGLDDIGAIYTKKEIELPMGNLKPEIARINPKMSIPFLVVNGGFPSGNALTDSRNIALFAATLPGGENLIPAGRHAAVEEVLDMIYSSNAGKLSFKSYQHSSPLFRFGLFAIGKFRQRVLSSYLSDSSNAYLADVYEEKLAQNSEEDVSLEIQVERANEVSSFLHFTLEKFDAERNVAAWLTGPDHSIADCLAAIWLQWVIWSKAPVPLSGRCLEFLERAKARPGWSKTMSEPTFAPTLVLKKLRIGALVFTGIISSAYWAAACKLS